MGSIQEGKWLTEHRRKQGLCFQQVNFVAGWIREKQPDQCIAEDGGDFGSRGVEGGVAIAHERSPLEDHPRRSPLGGRGVVWWM
jgi:hypothetical protein